MPFFDSLLKQILIVGSMLALPGVWWAMLGVTSITDISALDPGFTLMSFGALLFMEALCYVMLPLDAIPDCIPLLGKLDDGVAYIIMLLGIIIGGLGVYITVIPQALG